jgi:hypothetical protein
MYYIKTKAICFYPHFGQVLGLNQTGGEVGIFGVGIFVDSILQFLMQVQLI